MSDLLEKLTGRNVYTDDDEEWIPEKIVKSKMGPNQQMQFFIKWQGYPASDNTWVSELDLEGLDSKMLAEWRQTKNQQTRDINNNQNEIHRKKIQLKRETQRVAETKMNAFGTYDVLERRKQNDQLSGRKAKEVSYVQPLKHLARVVVAKNIEMFSMEGIPANMRYAVYKVLLQKHWLTNVSQIESLLDSTQTHLDLSEAPTDLCDQELLRALPEWLPKLTYFRVPQAPTNGGYSSSRDLALFNCLQKYYIQDAKITGLDLSRVEMRTTLPFKTLSDQYNNIPQLLTDSIFRWFRGLERLELRNTSTYILPGIPSVRYLRYVDLSGNPLVNNMGWAGLLMKTQQHLAYLRYDEPVPNTGHRYWGSWKETPEILHDDFWKQPENQHGGCYASLAELYLKHTQCNSTIIDMLDTNFVCMKILDLSYTDIEVKQLTHALQACSNLEEVDLTSVQKVNNFAALKSATKLKKLNLSQNDLGIAFISVIRSIPSVEDLNLSSTTWRDSPWAHETARTDVIAKPGNLKRLNVSYAPWVTPAFLLRGVAIFWPHSLKYLNISLADKLKKWKDEVIHSLNQALAKDVELVTELSEQY